MFWAHSLFVFYIFPTLVDYLSLLPVYYYLFYRDSKLIFLVIGWLLSFSGLVCKAVADHQLVPYRIKKKFGVIQEGLWGYSRHPDYFGEVIFRYGLYIPILGADLNLWWTGCGALLFNLIVYFYSIPVLEERLMEKWPTFIAQKKTINKFLFWKRNNDNTMERVRLITL